MGHAASRDDVRRVQRDRRAPAAADHRVARRHRRAAGRRPGPTAPDAAAGGIEAPPGAPQRAAGVGEPPRPKPRLPARRPTAQARARLGETLRAVLGPPARPHQAPRRRKSPRTGGETERPKEGELTMAATMTEPQSVQTL